MSLKGERIAVLAGLEYEDLELHYPCLRLMEEGAEVKVLAVKKEEIRGKHGLSIRAALLLQRNHQSSKFMRSFAWIHS